MLYLFKANVTTTTKASTTSLSTPFDPCLSEPCPQNGICQATSNPPSYSCMCVPNSPCVTNPCKNNGLCTSLNLDCSVICTCLPPYYGNLCQCE